MYNYVNLNVYYKAIALVSAKFSIFFSIETYFFYFTYPLIQNSHVSLFVLPSILLLLFFYKVLFILFR